MHRNYHKSTLRKIVFVMLSFLLSLLLFFLSVSIVLYSTLLNPDYIFNNMDSENYFIEKTDEITLSLTDLGHASGLDESFFPELINKTMVAEDTRTYLDNVFSGKGTKISTENFEKVLNNALDNYIEENNITDVDISSREQLVGTAASIYRSSLELPLFNMLAGFIAGITAWMPFIIAFVSITSIAICAALVFANHWKHRAVKYIVCASTGTFLSLALIPAYLMISEKIKKINIPSKALYNTVVKCGDDISMFFLAFSAFFLLVSAILFLLFRHMYKQVKE